jgi:FecR protein
MLGNWKVLAMGLGMAVIGLPARAVPTVAQPGALNYVEGQAKIGNQVVSSQSVGSSVLNQGDVLSTANGRAEFLLTPGVFMRIGKNSSVRMDSPELTNTRVELLQGEAMVEADLLHKEDHVLIAERGSITELDKQGIYAFDADQQTVKVYDGQATVRSGDTSVDLKKGKEVVLNQPPRAEKFDRDSAQASDPLYSWSKLRSEYLAEATASTARTYVVNTGGWYGPGWYWNPWWSMYSFVPGDPFFYNPFGWGLYSPVYYRGFGGRFYGGGPVTGVVAPRGQAMRSSPAIRSAPMMPAGGGMMRGRR